MTDTADWADYVLPATTQLEHLDVHTSYGHTYALINEPAVAPLGQSKPNTQIFRELAQRMGFDEPCFADSDEALARSAFTAEIDFETLRRVGWVKLPVPDAPLADGAFPTPSGRCLIDAPGLGVPDHVANHESVLSTPALAPALSAGDDLAAGAQLPQLELREREEPARHRGRAGAGDSRRAMRSRAALPTAQVVRVFNDRGTYVCKARVSDRARPGVVNGLGIWWRKLGLAGTNVNELTHQRLTDIGRAPAFYDCLVDVAPLEAAPLASASAVASVAPSA